MDSSSHERRSARASPRSRLHASRSATSRRKPWRNGGGARASCWPGRRPTDWSLRVSVADIDADGPFSRLPRRRSAGSRWSTAPASRWRSTRASARCRRGDAPLSLRRRAPRRGCRLLDGPTRDLNLMARQRARDVAAGHVAASTWSASCCAALYTAVAGEWQAGADVHAVDAGTLLWARLGALISMRATRDARSPRVALRRRRPTERASRSAWWLGYHADPDAPR